MVTIWPRSWIFTCDELWWPQYQLNYQSNLQLTCRLIGDWFINLTRSLKVWPLMTPFDPSWPLFKLETFWGPFTKQSSVESWTLTDIFFFNIFRWTFKIQSFPGPCKMNNFWNKEFDNLEGVQSLTVKKAFHFLLIHTDNIYLSFE